MKKLILFLVLIVIASGCATMGVPSKKITPQVIDLTVKVFLYGDEKSLDKVYRESGGSLPRVLGFYKDGEVHCLKWDFKHCGHELHHALHHKGKPSLTPDGKFHFELLEVE